MATVLEALRGLSAYPVPTRTLNSISGKRGVQLTSEVTDAIRNSEAFNLAVADVLQWMSEAPDISLSGQTYSFSEEQRTRLRNSARIIYTEFGCINLISNPTFGYKGSRL